MGHSQISQPCFWRLVSAFSLLLDLFQIDGFDISYIIRTLHSLVAVFQLITMTNGVNYKASASSIVWFSDQGSLYLDV